MIGHPDAFDPLTGDQLLFLGYVKGGVIVDEHIKRVIFAWNSLANCWIDDCRDMSTIINSRASLSV